MRRDFSLKRKMRKGDKRVGMKTKQADIDKQRDTHTRKRYMQGTHHSDLASVGDSRLFHEPVPMLVLLVRTLTLGGPAACTCLCQVMAHSWVTVKMTYVRIRTRVV